MVYKADMVEIVETAEQKLKRHEDALSLCMAEIQKLRAENAALKANASAHQTLREIYGNPAEPSGNRIRAAQAALSHESAPLKPVEAPLDLIAEPIEPLADVVARQRARADRMLRDDPQFRALRSRQVISLKPDGNSGDGNDSRSD
jgi:hypothetical protein